MTRISVPLQVEGNKEISVGLAYILKYIQLRISKDKNYMCVFIGPTGGGKSFGTLAIMELLFPNKPKQWIIDRVHYMPKEFLKSVTDENSEKGDVFSFDEAGVGQNSKNWQSLINRMINYTLQTFRYKNLITFFCLPSFSFLDSDTRKLVHSVFETVNIDRTRNVLIVKPLFIQMNHRSGKVYFKYLRVKYNGVLTPVKSIEIPKPSDELIDLYQQKKKNYTKDLYKDILYKVEEYEYKQNNKPSKLRTLTDRQMEILETFQKFGSRKEGSIAIGISEGSFYQAMTGIKRKLRIDSNEELKKLDLTLL